MGSIEEDELVRMVQDFIESESTSPKSSTSSNCHALNHGTQYFILQVLLIQYFIIQGLYLACFLCVFLNINGFQDILRSECDKAAVAKVMKYVLKHMRDREGAEKTTSLSRWLVKRMKMDGLNASLCQTSWATSSGCPAGGSFSTFQFSPPL